MRPVRPRDSSLCPCPNTPPCSFLHTWQSDSCRSLPYTYSLDDFAQVYLCIVIGPHLACSLIPLPSLTRLQRRGVPPILRRVLPRGGARASVAAHLHLCSCRRPALRAPGRVCPAFSVRRLPAHAVIDIPQPSAPLAAAVRRWRGMSSTAAAAAAAAAAGDSADLGEGAGGRVGGGRRRGGRFRRASGAMRCGGRWTCCS